MLFLAASASMLYAQDEPPTKIDAEFTQTLLRMDEFSWDALGDENIPLEQQWEPVLEMMNQLRRYVPSSFLKQGVSGSYKPINEISSLQEQGFAMVDDPAQFRGRAFELQGFVTRVEEIPLNPAEKSSYEIPTVFRCRFTVPGVGSAEILSSFVPSDWKRDEPIQEHAALTGIFIKRIRFEKESQENETLPSLDALSSSVRNEMLPLFVTSRIEWFPNTFLGSLGFDVGSFEQVPPLKINDLKQKKIDVAPSLQLLDRNEIVRRAFKFTEADREPFYGLLKATKTTPPGRIEQEARQSMEKKGRKKASAIALFNDPAGTRGEPVLLYGTAKRVLPTLVEDKEVQSLFGIERYYQIYLYTDDSQGNPLVVCVTSLPEGMPTGSNDDYSETITVAAIPYKLWVYETSAKLEDGDGRKPSYAPLLVGRAPFWHPKEKTSRAHSGEAISKETQTTFSFALFAILALVWFFFRRVKRQRPIEFKLKK